VTDQPVKKTSGLAIAAFVLSLLFFAPPLPFIGFVLGIVALVKARKEPMASQGLAIASIVMAVSTVFLTGILASIAIPSFVGYLRRARASEAEAFVSEIFSDAVSYHDVNGQLPASTPLTPALRCCENPDGRCPPDPAMWADPSWQALGFSVSDPIYYQYQLVSDGATFTARALGDLDCDGVYSTFERAGALDSAGNVVGSRGLYREQPTE
jgi:hypothetical protein